MTKTIKAIPGVEWEKIEPNVWRYEKEGDEISGVLVSVEDHPKYDSKIYQIDTESTTQEGVLTVFGTTVLDNRMSYVKLGELVLIVYKGTELNQKKQETKMFEVFKARSEAS